MASTVNLGGVEFEVDDKGRLIGPNGPIASTMPSWTEWAAAHPERVPPRDGKAQEEGR